MISMRKTCQRELDIAETGRPERYLGRLLVCCEINRYATGVEICCGGTNRPIGSVFIDDLSELVVVGVGADNDERPNPGFAIKREGCSVEQITLNELPLQC